MLTVAVFSSVIFLPGLSSVAGQPTFGAPNNQLNQTSTMSSENQTQINGSATAYVDTGIPVPASGAVNSTD